MPTSFGLVFVPANSLRLGSEPLGCQARVVGGCSPSFVEFSFFEVVAEPPIRALANGQRTREMRYAERRFLLNEHIPKEASSQGRMERRLYVDRLEPGEAIIPPEVLRNPWSLFDERGEQTTRIFGSQHYRWVLP